MEKIENKYIKEYSLKYGDKLQKIKHHVEIEKDDELQVRAGLEKKIVIHERCRMFKLDTRVNRMRIQTISKFNQQSKQKGYEKIL